MAMKKDNLMKSVVVGSGMLFMIVCGNSMLNADDADTGSGMKTDSVTFGNMQSEKEHGFTVSGPVKVAPETIKAEMGTLIQEYKAQTLNARGSSISFKMKLSQDKNAGAAISTPYILEIQEIHNRRPQVFGYTVQVNGKDIYFRTYDEMGAGPNNYFVQVPRELSSDGILNVTLRNDGASPFSIGRIWAYSDFFRLAAAEGTYQKMPIVDEATVYLPVISPKGKNLTWEEQVKYKNKVIGTETDTKAWQDLKAMLAGTGYGCGIFINLSYADKPYSSIVAQIDKGLERVIKHDVDFQLAFNAGVWGYHPNGPDGLGGYFSDIKYSRVRFDDAAKTYRPSWPGGPGGVTSPTWNDPQLQKYLKYRLTQSVQYYVDKRDYLKAQGSKLPSPVVNLEWGLYIEDYNNATVADAKKDGIDLAPENSHSAAQKMWFYRNVAKVSERSGETFYKAAGRDCVLVDRGTVKLPELQTFDECYFQTWADPISPLNDDKWAGWQEGVSKYTWATGELLPHLPAAYFDYINALGKLTCPNLERAALPTLEYLQTAYQRGFRNIFICNAVSGDAEIFAPDAKGMDDRKCDPPLQCDWKLMGFRFVKDEPLGPAGQLLNSENVILAPSEHGACDSLRASKPGIQGRITYRVTNDVLDRSKAVMLKTIGKIAEGDGNSIEIAVGDDPASLQKVATLTRNDLTRTTYYPWTSFGSVDLGESVRNKKNFVLQFTLNSKAPDNVTIERFSIVVPWEKTSGQAGGQSVTIKQKRIMNLWLQDRAVFERLQNFYRQLKGEDEAYRKAAEMSAQGRYRSAYRALAGEMSLILPAKFAVRGNGKLGPYPMSVKLADDDKVMLVELKKAGPKEFEFELKTEKDQACQIQIDGLKDGEVYAVKAMGANLYSILPAQGADGIKVADGKLKTDLTVKIVDEKIHKLPPKLSGGFKSFTEGGILIETQAPGLWMDNPIFVPVARSAKYTRAQDGAGAPPSEGRPQVRDLVDLVIDSNGVAQEVKSTFGKDSGRIKVFYPPVVKGAMNNGIIELENGKRYEFSNMWGFTEIRVPPLKEFIRLSKPQDLVKAFAPGTEVELTYCPYAVNGKLPRMIKVSAPKSDGEKKK
jgi:hypothetical protein